MSKSFLGEIERNICVHDYSALSSCVLIFMFGLDVLSAHTCWMSLLIKSFHEFEYLNLFGVIMLFLFEIDHYEL